MLVRTLVASAIFFLSLYPRAARWSIEGVKLTSVVPYFDNWLFVIDLHLVAQVKIVNPNHFGSFLERSRYEVFGVWRQYSSVRQLGVISLTRSWIPRRGQSAVLSAAVHLQALDIGILLKLLVTILRQGSLTVLALGSAQVQSLNSVRTLVGVKCLETLNISFSDSRFAWLATHDGSSDTCKFSYQPLPRAIRQAQELPLLDRRYVFSWT